MKRLATHRGATTGVMLLTLFGVVARSGSAGSLRVVAAGGPCLRPSTEGFILCYPPTDKVSVERLLPVHVLDPSRIVRDITGESLTQLTTFRRGSSRTGKPKGGVLVIDYDFGPAPDEQPYATVTPMSTAGAAPEHPRWTTVEEFAPQMRFRVAPGRIHHVGESFNGSDATWELDEELSAHRDLYVFIISPGPRAEVVRIGKALLAQDKQGRKVVPTALPTSSVLTR